AGNNPESAETLSVEVLLGTSNFHAGVSMLESLKQRDQQVDKTYQKATYYRGLEFYNERAFENSISMFMRSEKFPIDAEMAALATYRSEERRVGKECRARWARTQSKRKRRIE